MGPERSRDTPWSVTMKIEAISVEVFHCELPQAPRLFLQGLHDPRPQCSQLLVRCVDLRREDPVDRGLERAGALPEKDCNLIAGYRAEITFRNQPSDLESKVVAVILLSALHIFDRKLGDRV